MAPKSAHQFLLMSFCLRATVHVRVNDVNEFAPVFVEKLYRVAVTEGKLYDRILRVEAIDGDCSPQYSQICYYEILTPNIPFLIDNDGKNPHPPHAHHSCFPVLFLLCQLHLKAELCYITFPALLIYPGETSSIHFVGCYNLLQSDIGQSDSTLFWLFLSLIKNTSDF